MSNVSIDQMNEAIRIFMGVEPYQDSRYGTLYNSPIDGKTCFNLHYHSSWDWLMPVVEKIAALSPEDIIHIEFGKTYSRCNYWNLESGRTHVFDENGDTPIQAVYKAVYQFIQWYQKQKEDNNE